MKLTVAWIGKTKQAAIDSLTEEYLRRLARYAEVESAALKDEASLLRMVSGNSRSRTQPVLILLDSKGQQMSSEELATFLRHHQERSPAPLIFAIGPASGFAKASRETASKLLSLGRMTIAHELARVVLLEQLYRAYTILQGHPYHLGH